MTEESTQSKPHLKVATMGNKGHGKTTLTAAINHVLSLKGRAEKEAKPRGSDVHRTEYESDKRFYEQTDAPADAIKNSITSAAQFDGGILVVSAADGPMPQTREHLQNARQAGITRVVVFLNNCDMVDDKELLSLVEMELRELLSQCEFPGDDIPVIRGSALKALAARSADDQWARKIIDLVASLDEYIPLSDWKIYKRGPG